MSQTKKVHLVLSSGGARGMAHIGVIEKLEEDGYEIIDIVGCSMGAVIGGLYASGHLPQYREWLLNLNRSDIFRLMDFTLAKHGFVKGEKVFSAILEITGHHKIEDLKIPFKAVATEVDSGEEVIFDKGDLFEALRASISIPGIFTPVKYQNKYLVDGGVINPLPLNLVQRQEDALVVAVDINAPNPLEAMNSMTKNQKSWLNLNWPFSRKEELEKNSSPYNLINVLQTSYDHMQNRLIKLMETAYPPDLLITVPRNTCGMFDFYRAKEVIELGRKAYDEALWQKQEVK